MPTIEYSITPFDLLGHYYQVDLTIHKPNPDGQRIQLPSWIPGSYLIRDFSKHIVSIEAFEGNDARGKTLSLKKINTSTWEISHHPQPVTIRILVYAFDTSVRTAYLDQSRGFFNSSSLCLQVLGQAHLPCKVTINKPVGKTHAAWHVETTLAPREITPQGFGTYTASSYDELIDHPVALGQFTSLNWKSHGIPHRMVVQGTVNELDFKRLQTDLKAICDTHIQFFEPKSLKAPFDRYLFFVNAIGNGYGGLEHRSSTALLCNRSDLPYLNELSNELPNQKAYEDFLGLCSHEYFHAWMVKKIQPRAFQPYVLDRKNFTTLLWLFEGFTSYYDDLQLFRSNRISKKRYLERILDNLNGVLRSPGRLRQSLADSSFDAWTKYYQADENTPNAVVSYYAKGAVVALALDLTIRAYTKHKKSLDDVMRQLWKSHGGYGNHPGDGLHEGESGDDFSKAILSVTGAGFKRILDDFSKNYIYGKHDLPIESLLAENGISITQKKFSNLDRIKNILGIRTVNADGWLKVTHVLSGGQAQAAGIAPGDILISMNQERITPSRWDQLLNQVHSKRIEILYARHDVLANATITLQGKPWLQFELISNE